MKKFSILFFLCIFSSILFSQAHEKCGTMEALDIKLKNNPALAVRMAYANTKAAIWEWEFKHREQRHSGIVTIPVVVHVVYKNAIQNISDAQVLSEIEILNQDYRRLNPDAGNTLAEFDTLAADMGIEFCLASTDPDGNPTSGITRTSTTGGQLFGYFGPTDDVKSAATGGVDPWPADQYLNIWVCDLVPILLGYAQFPGGDPLTDGVVINYTAFGTMGTVSAPYNGGRTTVHEVGHYLGLRHIWGDNADCIADDLVDDTPHSGDSHSGCDTTVNTCTDAPYDYHDMIQNYMDYSDDACMNIFTLGQKDRIYSFLNTDRASLLSSGGCSLAGISNAHNTTSEIKCVPSVGDGKFRIILTEKFTGQITITDAVGRIVKTSKVNDSNSEIDISGNSAGIYFVHFAGENNSGVAKYLLVE